MAVIYDRAAERHASRVVGSLASRGVRVEALGVEGGEQVKTVESVVSLWRWMLERGLTRSSAVVAVGGGSVLDAAGFAASTYMRGVEWAAVPTTTLAALDAAVGGKTAVNLGAKNVIGSFHHPSLVAVDVEPLLELPDGVYAEGFSELVKHALLSGGDDYAWVAASAPRLRARDAGALEEAVYRSLAFKLSVVAADYREARGPRLLLNLGHTVAHALEAAEGYSVSHGRAVAVGLVVELEASTEVAGLSPSVVDEVRSVLRCLGLPTAPPRHVRFNDLARFVAADKKRSGGSIRMPLLEAPGRPRVVELGLGEALAVLARAWRRCGGR